MYINVRDFFFNFTVYASFKNTFSVAVVLNLSFLEFFVFWCFLLFLSSFLLQTVRAPDKSPRIGAWIPAISRIPTVRDWHVHGERTEHARQPNGAQDSTISPSISGTGSLRETTRLQGQATSPSLRSKVYAALVKTCARRNTARLHPCCARRTSLRALDSPDKAQHQLSPQKLRIPIPCYTSYNIISPSYTHLPGVMTTLALQTSLILVIRKIHSLYSSFLI